MGLIMDELNEKYPTGSAKLLFKTTIRKYVKRKGLENILEAINETDFYTAPASAKYHGAVEEGLARHSLMVFDRLMRYKDDIGLPEESLAIVGLLHDLCKIGNYKVSMRNTKTEGGRWISVPYYDYAEDVFPVGHGEKSIMMILEHMKLTPEEMIAIRWHMGGFSPKEDYYTLGRAYETNKLALYLHIADMETTYVDKV